MILREATIKYSGNDPDELSKGSEKRVCKTCDICGRVNWIGFRSYKNLCHKCSMIGKNKGKLNPMYGTTRSPETLKKVSDRVKGELNPMFGIHRIGKDSPNWGGGKIEITCDYCGEKILVYEKLLRINNFCNHECHSRWLCGKPGIHKGKFGADHPSWKGGIRKEREHVLIESQCIKLNKRFEGSEMHHIMSSVVIYVPKDIHRNIPHNMKNGKNIDLINMLALKYLIGDI